jgi:deoxyribodipyrimidine photolyase-like uncharacterized protein
MCNQQNYPRYDIQHEACRYCEAFPVIEVHPTHEIKTCECGDVEVTEKLPPLRAFRVSSVSTSRLSINRREYETVWAEDLQTARELSQRPGRKILDVMPDGEAQAGGEWHKRNRDR